MPRSLTYTQSNGTPDGRRYYQDVELSPVTLSSGALGRRLDPLRYPRSGLRVIYDPTISGVAPASGARGATVTVVITGANFDPGVTVSVSGAGVTVSNRRLDATGNRITADLTIAAGAGIGARDVTVANLDTGSVTATGAFTVT